MTDQTPATAIAATTPRHSGARRGTRPMPAERVDARMLALMRCVLAFSAFAIVCIDASDPLAWVDLARISLGLYCAYSAALALTARGVGWPQPHRAQHWIDVFFYVYLVALTDGTDSIFFSFFLFAILVASFTRGFREGMLVTLVSLAGFCTVAVLMESWAGSFELNRALMRPVYLFVFGYMISYWGGYERLLKRRLALLNEINNAWSPRFGMAHAIAVNLDRLLDFYQAESCMLVLQRPGTPAQFEMYRRQRGKPAESERPLTMTEKSSYPMLCLPETLGAYFHARDGARLQRWRSYAAWDVESKLRLKDHQRDCEALATLLDAQSFLTAPYQQRNGTGGRLFLIGGRRGYDQSDVHFLAQASAAVATVVENVTLMDELIVRASEQERERISRDLHDSTIQPYIGLKLALNALARDAGQDNPVAGRLAELVEMAGATVRDLRDYAANFAGKSSMPGDFLLDSIRKKAERLRRFYGIEVRLDLHLAEPLEGRLAAEVLQLVAEGLSNILRHTSARAAFVHLASKDQWLTLDIGNEAADPPPPFTPRSISGRAAALGGSTEVERSMNPDGSYTVVRVAVPLNEMPTR